MPKSKLFWVLMSAFQVIFGLVVFIVTRNVYLDDSFGSGNRPSDIAPISSVENRQSLDINPAMLRSLMDLEPDSADPAAISMLANEYFEDGRYAEAAEFYEQLLAFGPSNADVHNNLGLTLHYLGRSDEALARLREGVALDPENQRIWLTLGFVNSETGNVDDARAALTTAIRINAANPVGQSAAKMLANLAQ
jgi:tetratricopeptide (TPR) repeat protein